MAKIGRPGAHQADGVIGGRAQAGDQPDIGNEDAEMGVVGDQRAAGGAAAARHGDAVGARFRKPFKQLLHRGGHAGAAETGERRASLLHEARPELGPVRPRAERQQVGPDQPVHVGAPEAPDGQDVGDGPGLGLEAQNTEIVRQLGGVVLVMVDAVHEAAGPGAGGRVHAPFDLRCGAAVGEGAQAAVDIDAERADHLGQPPLRQHARHRHLAKPQMRMHEAEREGRVAVALRLDEGNLPLVPADRRASLQRQPARGERLQALGDALRLRQRRQQRTGRKHQRRRADGKPGGRRRKLGTASDSAGQRRARALSPSRARRRAPGGRGRGRGP